MTLAREIIGDAYRKIGVVAHDEPMTAEQLAVGERELRRMLLSWQNLGYNLWTTTEMTVPLTTAASYTLTGRPLRVHSVRYRNASGLDMPLSPMTRQAYYDLPDKATAGFPNGWFYDRQRDAGTLYIWQPLASVTTETLRITCERAIEFGDDIDVPPEWENAVVYGLGAAMFQALGGIDVTAEATGHLALALAGDREESVWFTEECD